MSKLELLYYPNKLLSLPCSDIKEDSSDLQKLIDEMFILMREHNGVGLSAPQVGINKNLFVIDIGSGTKTFINPHIKEVSRKQGAIKEKCLSLPDVEVRVRRPLEIKISYLDRSFKNRTLVASGALSRVIQHEYDHLDGILITNYKKGPF